MTVSPAAPVRTVQSLSSTSQVTLLRSQGQWAALHSPQEHWPACCSVLGGLLRAWKGLHYSPEAPSQSECRGTALGNYLNTGQESKDSFRTIFLGPVSRIWFWVSSKAPCAHKKPGKHLTLQLRGIPGLPGQQETPLWGQTGCCVYSHWNMAVTQQKPFPHIRQ